MTDLDAFVRLSAALTGFDRMEVLGTGQAPAYFDWVTSRCDLFALQELWRIARGALDDAAIERMLADETLGTLARQINFLWYTAQWKTPFEPGFAAATTFVSPDAYREAFDSPAHHLQRMLVQRLHNEGDWMNAISSPQPGFADHVDQVASRISRLAGPVLLVASAAGLITLLI